MTTRPNPDPLHVPNEDELRLVWRVRGLVLQALQELEVRPVDWDRVDAILRDTLGEQRNAR